jgi:hypothetical protein
MLTDRKKQLEIVTADFFRKLNPDFPKGKLAPSESPDFVLTLNTRLSYGMEITRLYSAGPPVSTEGDNLFALQTEFMTRCRHCFEQYISEPFWVKFLFSPVRVPEESAMLAASVRIGASLKKICRNFSGNTFSYLIPENELPSFLDAVLVLKHPMLTEAIWDICDLPGPRNHLVHDISQTILRKEEKLPLYRAGNHAQYWLLVIADVLSPLRKLNTANVIGNYTFSSAFHKVFLLELMNTRYFQLV